MTKAGRPPGSSHEIADHEHAGSHLQRAPARSFGDVVARNVRAGPGQSRDHRSRGPAARHSALDVRDCGPGVGGVHGRRLRGRAGAQQACRRARAPKGSRRHIYSFCARDECASPDADSSRPTRRGRFASGLCVPPVTASIRAVLPALERLSSLAPAGASTEAFGWMGSGLTAGNAMGSALAGVLVTADGGRASIGAAVALILVAALACEPWPARFRRPVEQPDFSR